jgi:hypothetical protein
LYSNFVLLHQSAATSRKTAAARHRICQSHREFSKALDCQKQQGIAKSHQNLPTWHRHRWQILHPCPYLQLIFDQALLSRSNPPAHLIRCIESSEIRRFHEIRRDPRIPVYFAAIGKTSDCTVFGTHSRFTS